MESSTAPAKQTVVKDHNPPPKPTVAFNQARLGIATFVITISVLAVFVANLTYLFGSTFHQASRNHAFTIVAVNYDTTGSTLWAAFTEAYSALRSDSFASIDIRNASQYPDAQLLTHAVRQQSYWGALYVHAGASSRLSDAVTGQAASYNASQAVTYVWNEIRYPAVSASVIQAGLLQLQTVAKSAYQAGATSQIFRGMNSTQAQIAVDTYINPFDAAEINVSPAPQAEKAFYNTVVIAMSIVQQNIFLITFSGMARQFGLFCQPFKTSGTWALCVGLAFTLVGSLLTTTYIWAFREGWEVTGRQFAITWMVLWLVQHIYYQLIDGTLSLIPIQYYSFLIITWVFLNIASTVFPLENGPGFYRWGHALPAYQSLQVLINVWTNASHRLYESLPVLFSWWVVSGTYAAVGIVKRVRTESGTGKLKSSHGNDTSPAVS